MPLIWAFFFLAMWSRSLPRFVYMFSNLSDSIFCIKEVTSRDFISDCSLSLISSFSKLRQSYFLLLRIALVLAPLWYESNLARSVAVLFTWSLNLASWSSLLDLRNLTVDSNPSRSLLSTSIDRFCLSDKICCAVISLDKACRRSNSD